MDSADTGQESTPQLSDQLPEGGDVDGEVGEPQQATYYYVCQVESCGTTLTTAYDKKCRTCATHRKTDDVLIDGELQRFCQKCSRFHGLGEFDEGRRNCRRQLMEHNRRQRRLRHLRRSYADDDAPPPRHVPESRSTHHQHIPQSQIDALLAAAASSQQPAPVATAAPLPPQNLAGPGMSLTDMLLLQHFVERIQYDYALQNKVAELLRNVAGLGMPPMGSAGLAPPPPPPPPPPQAPPPPPMGAAWGTGGTTYYPQPTRPTNGQSLEELRHLEQALAAALGLPPSAPPGLPPPPPENSEHK